MNQAITRSKVDNGDVSEWFEHIGGADAADEQHEYFMQYVGKYLNIIKSKKIAHASTYKYVYYLSDGSSFARTSSNNSQDWIYSPGDLEVCYKKHPGGISGIGNAVGTCAFAFMFSSDEGFRTYDYAWNGTEASLKNGIYYACYSTTTWHAYCTRLIQYNGWKIPDDYPYRVKYK